VQGNRGRYTLKLIVATKNKGKIKEFKEMFANKGIEVLSILDLDDQIEIDETGTTFAENALLKATVMSEKYNEIVIADDSGLMVDALGGEPGIYSARYAGESKNDDANIEKVLTKLTDVRNENRKARFVCALAIVGENIQPTVFEGTCEGIITTEKCGENGFGYDPIFYLPQYGKTMAEISKDEKNKISHRGKALQQLLKEFDSIIN
jgi:XTP/dITP diphosphohydrolase